jgi:hypothetical protein
MQKILEWHKDNIFKTYFFEADEKEVTERKNGTNQLD